MMLYQYIVLMLHWNRLQKSIKWYPFMSDQIITVIINNTIFCAFQYILDFLHLNLRQHK